MARNEEKHYGKLNRLILQREKEEYMKKHPKRPRLDILNTVEEIKEWIPSIKSDMNFYLKQSQVVCYSEQKVVESRLKVSELEKEYKAFVRKMRKLSPENLDAVPWTHRPYRSKNEGFVTQSDTESKVFIPIATPILESSPSPQGNYVHDIDLPFNNKPLKFNLHTPRKNVCESPQTKKYIDDSNCLNKYKHCVSYNENYSSISKGQSEKKDALIKFEVPFENKSCSSNARTCKTDPIEEQKNKNSLHSGSIKLFSSCKDESGFLVYRTNNESSESCSISCKNVLGLDYLSSSESDEENC